MKTRIIDVFNYCNSRMPFLRDKWGVYNLSKVLKELSDAGLLFVLSDSKGVIYGVAGFEKNIEKKELKCIFMGTSIDFKKSFRLCWNMISKELGISDDWYITGNRNKNGKARKICWQVAKLKKAVGIT